MMAAPTDLDGMFENDADSLSSRLMDLVSAGKLGHAPGKLQATWKPESGSYRTVGEVAWQELRTAGVRNNLEALKRAIQDTLGETPIGTLRVRGYTSGDSGAMPLDMTRSIRPWADGAPTMNQEAVIAILRGENAQLRNQVSQLVSEVIKGSSSAHAFGAEGLKAVATLGTARAAGSAANDVGSIGSLVALMVIGLGYPVLRRALDLPKHASPVVVAKTLQTQLEQAFADPDAAPEGDSPKQQLPANDHRPALPSPPDGKAESDQATLDRLLEGDPCVLIEALKRKPEKAKALLEAAKQDFEFVLAMA